MYALSNYPFFVVFMYNKINNNKKRNKLTLTSFIFQTD